MWQSIYFTRNHRLPSTSFQHAKTFTNGGDNANAMFSRFAVDGCDRQVDGRTENAKATCRAYTSEDNEIINMTLSDNVINNDTFQLILSGVQLVYDNSRIYSLCCPKSESNTHLYTGCPVKSDL